MNPVRSSQRALKAMPALCPGAGLMQALGMPVLTKMLLSAPISCFSHPAEGMKKGI